MPPHIRTQVQDKSRKTSHPNLHLDRNPVLFLSKAELNFWVHICTELPGAQSTQRQKPYGWEASIPQSHWPSQHSVPRTPVVNRTL